mgnify:CR=1 FL=1|jgi:hypothetical protein
MKKKELVLLVLITVCIFSFNTYAQNAGDPIGYPYNGIQAYSNGLNTGTGYGNDSLQCTSYITRFYQRFLGLKNPDPGNYGWGNAGEFFVKCQEAGFSGFKQNGKIPPLPNEILCYGGSGYGHVAVITKVDIVGNTIEIIDQNRNRSKPYDRLSISNNNGRYTISNNLGNNYYIQGWLALPFLYPAGTMIKTASSPKVYVVLDTGKKMWIPNESVFHSHGLSFAKVIEVTEQEMQSYITYGRSTNWSEPYLHTTFFRASGDYLFKYGSHIYLYDYSQGRKRKISTYEIMQSWGYDWSDVRSSGQYNASTGSDLWYRDGTLVKARNSSTVYVVENGYKRAFETWELFVAMDYKIENIVLLPDIDINNNIGFRGTRQMINSVNIWKTITSGTFTGKNGKGGGGEINPSLSTSTSSLNFGLSTTTRSFTIKNTGGGTLTGSLSDNRSWISVSSSGFNLSAEQSKTITVTVNRSGLSSGTSTGTVTVSSNYGNKTINVSATKDSPPPDPDPPTTNNLVKNGDFSNNTNNWLLEVHENCSANWSIVSGALKVNITRLDSDAGSHPYRVQPFQKITSLKPNTKYRLKFKYKGSINWFIALVSKNQYNWKDVAPEAYKLVENVSSNWKTMDYTFTTKSDIISNNKVNFQIGTKTGTFYLDDVELTEEGSSPLLKSISRDSLRTSELNVLNNYSLSQNYPNPFNPETIISFSIPQQEFVVLKIYNMLGKEIALLVNGIMNKGEHKIVFDKQIPAGVYFYQIKAGRFVQTKKMIFAK